MGSRRDVLSALDRLAFSAELLDDGRARAYANAAWALRQQTGDLGELLASGELAKIDGIGKSILAIVEEVLGGHEPAALDAMASKLPAGLFEIRKIRGLGPKKVKALWSELGITTLGELEYACRENRLLDLRGFGKKTQAQVLAQIAELRSSAGKLRRDQAAALLASALLTIRPARHAFAGELRRGAELVTDVVLVVSEGQETEIPRVRVVHAEPERFGLALLYATGSQAHLDLLQARAEERGIVMSETELRGPDGPLAAPEEDDVYAALGLIPTTPERREEGVPLVERGQAAPRLIERHDLRGALHNHTVASDGTNTLREMRDAAAARELEYLGISEHSISAFYAKGLEVERLRAQASEIAALNDGKSSCTLLTGVESDILERGELDYGDDVLGDLEVVVASVHRRYAQDREQATARLVNAALNPRTCIVGHPTGRLLLGRPPTELDMGAFLDACAESRCAVELNANPHRLDLSEEHLVMARERGVLVSIAADAHRTDELDFLEHGVALARRAGLTPDQVLNTRTLAELRDWLDQRRLSVTLGGQGH